MMTASLGPHALYSKLHQNGADYERNADNDRAQQMGDRLVACRDFLTNLKLRRRQIKQNINETKHGDTDDRPANHRPPASNTYLANSGE